MPIDALRIQEQKAKISLQNQRKPLTDLNNTLKGVLLNNHIKASNENYLSFDEIKDSLLINDSNKYYSSERNIDTYNNGESSFDTKKALKPLIIGTAVVLAGCVGITSILKNSSKVLANTPNYEKLPDLAVNMNIKEEPQFAIYRAIRDPNRLNILGAAGVIIMSGITITLKNFVEGFKDIWLKKQSADIEKNLQENLISVERNSFSGKLKVVNELMDKNVKYFDEIINKKAIQGEKKGLFSEFISFKGNNEENDKTNEKIINHKLKKNNNWKYIALGAGMLASALIAGKLCFSNLRKTSKYTSEFVQNFADRTAQAIDEISENANKDDLPKIIQLLKSITATPESIKKIGKKYNLSDIEIEKIIDDVEKEKKTIFANAPLALGGIPEKIQYYCYIDEDRGHLYNWILNPKNKFTKHIFMGFTATSVGGYLFNQTMEAAKEAAVLRENAKTDLDLKKRLVDVEIANYRAKKESAIQPLVDNFTKQANDGNKSKDDLKRIADNILTEIKHGPPYIYS